MRAQRLLRTAAAPAGVLALGLPWDKHRRWMPAPPRLASPHCSCAGMPFVPRKPPAGAGTLEVLLVRHGESENNALFRGIVEEVSSESELEAVWLARRREDPGLTPGGLEQAEVFADAYAADLSARGCVVVCSPLLRALQTAAPLVQRLGCEAIVRPDVFESGGCYTLGEGGCRGGPGKCLSADEVRARFPGFDVSALPARGGWYRGGWEADAEARVRCAGVASWLRSPEIRQHARGRMLVLVCHGHFIDLLLKDLIGRPDDPSEDIPGINNFSVHDLFFHSPNTSTTRLTISDGRRVQLHTFGDTGHLRVSGGSLPETVSVAG